MVDFFVIGPPKCGTTTLYHWLRTNHSIFLPIEKEPHYFMFKDESLKYKGPGDNERLKRMVTTDQKAYINLFGAKKINQLAGDCSTMYFYSVKAIENIKEYNPNAKIIIVLRNPVERAFSHFMHQVRDGYEKATDPLKSFLLSQKRIDDGYMPFWDYESPGKYSKWLPIWKSEFKNVLILDYVQLMTNPDTAITKVASFLGIPNEFQVSKDQVFNKSGNPAMSSLNRLMKRKTVIHRLFSFFLSAERRAKIKNKILNANNRAASLKNYPTFSDYLKESYSQDIVLYNQLSAEND